MGFPSSKLPAYVGIAPGADPVAPGGWNFTEITDDVRTGSGIQIQAGRPDEVSQVDATRVQIVVDNRSGDYSRVNPNGAWYGQLDKGTPAEVRVTAINDSFTRSVGAGLGTDTSSGLAWTTSSGWSVSSNTARAALATANLATTATVPASGDDVDITVAASISAVATGAAWVHAVLVRYADSSNYYRLHTEFHLAGVIGVKIVKRVAGVDSDVASFASTSVTYSAGTTIRTRVRAVGPTLQIRVWRDGDPEPSTWHLQGADDDVTSNSATGLYEWRVAGNTNAGTMTVTIDDYRVDVIRAATPVPEWPVRWNQAGSDATAPIVGAGILRRLSQGQSAVRSALYRQLSGLTYTQGYWPLEDGSDATSASSALPGGSSAAAVGVQFGQSDAPPGAATSATLQTAVTSTLTGTVASPSTTPNGYAAMAFFKLGSAIASAGNALRLSATGKVVRWQIAISNTGFNLNATDADGTSVISASIPHGLTVTDWFSVQLETEESGGNTNWALIWNQVGETGFTATSGSYAGTADRITGFFAQAPVDSTQISHVWLGDNDLPYVDSTFLAVSSGYAGETAGNRLARLAEDADVPLRIFGDPADTAPMGAQRPATFLELAVECEQADQGLLFETGAGLGYLTHAFRRNPTAVMTLDFDSGHIAAPPEPTDDDQRLRNQIRLARTGGSEVTAQDSDSIAKSGAYTDELTVNLYADTQLPYHAGWRLHLGTFGDLRWPRVELNLARNPSLIPTWLRMRVGSRITIANPPAAVGTDDLDLIVEGWTETLGYYSWDVVLACSPAKLWDVGVYDDTSKRYDSRATTMNATAAAGATTLVLTFPTPSDAWSRTAGSQPYDLLISGERVRVPVGGMGAVTGSGPYTQTITGATRAINGISKSLPAGAEVHIATPGYYAL